MLYPFGRSTGAITTARRPLAVRRAWPAIVLCQFIALLASVSSRAAAAPPDPGLVDQLRKGGYVLFVRHFPTNPDQGDTDPLHLDNIAAQRQLTDEGRKQAVAFGQALRALAIPVGNVVCSQFHRAHETAILIAAGEPVATPDVSESRWVKSDDEKQRRVEALRHLLSTVPAPGKNTLIVSHGPNLREAAGEDFSSVGEGEVVVFQPAADGTFRMIARVYPPSIWTQWSTRLRAP